MPVSRWSGSSQESSVNGKVTSESKVNSSQMLVLILLRFLGRRSFP